MMRHILMLCAVCASTGLAGEVPRPEWEDPAVNSINRLPPRTYAMPLKDEAAALTDALEPETPYKLSLNGTWKLSWAGDPALREKDFWKTGFDDSRWFDVRVPGCVELQGFGSPGYTNVRYPFADLSHPTNTAFAAIRDRDTGRADYNPVSSYRRTFTVPPDWKGRDVILRFDGVYSAYYVWVNGKFVGYAEDSKLPSEFDITEYLKDFRRETGDGGTGEENVLAVEVYRWCDGSYLEDQDMFRFSGIFRDVTLWAKPKGGIWDFAVKTTPVDGYAKWKLEVEEVKSKSEKVKSAELEISLYDAEHKKVGDLHCSTSTSDFDLIVDAPHLWSAETPYLYTLVIRKGEDIRMKRIGFKEQKIVGNAFLVNGKPVKFKGVNRHEASPAGGRTVTLDEMMRDVTLMKRYNVNTVRTSHYPDHRLWYDLCDRYGIYLVAEANVEGHEAWCSGNELGKHGEWTPSIVERNRRQVQFYRNNPSVTMWSAGNETGHGDGFRAAIAAVKETDPTRPVHWQVGCQDADVDGWMYPSVDWLDRRGQLGDRLPGGESAHRDEYGTDTHQTAGKCFFLCEYAHAMGTALGNFQEYWDVYYRYDSLCGGCVWDWIDQAVWKRTDRLDPKTGRAERHLAYGGDWDEEPNDGPFCCNGLIGPDREPTSKLREVAHVHRNLVVTRKGDGFELWNRHLFTFADAFDATCALVVDGRTVATRPLKVPHLAPLSRGEQEVPDFGVDAPGERFVNFEFALKADTAWAKKGWVVARDQVKVGNCSNDRMFECSIAAAKDVKIKEDDRTVTVTAGGTRAVFSRRTGTLCELVMGGRTILRDAAEDLVAGPRLTCLRAFTDNDRWMRDGADFSVDRKVGSCLSRGLTQLSYHARPIVVSNGVVRTAVAVTGSKSAGFEHEADWSFGTDGSVTVDSRVVPHGTMPPALPRLGLSLVLDPALEQMEWYGRGPHENYVDRATSAFFGRWRSTVTAQYEGAVRPQDCGYKTGVRWVAFADEKGRGIRFSASEPLCVQALHFSREDIELARHRNGGERFRTPLCPRPEVMLNLDVRQTGLGGASCGPRPLEKYRFPIVPTSWRVRMEPLR